MLFVQVRRWDAETLVNTTTWNSNKAIYCIAAAAASPALVAFGGADSAWRLWDSRQDRNQQLVSWVDIAVHRHCRLHFVLPTFVFYAKRLSTLLHHVPTCACHLAQHFRCLLQQPFAFLMIGAPSLKNGNLKVHTQHSRHTFRFCCCMQAGCQWQWKMGGLSHVDNPADFLDVQNKHAAGPVDAFLCVLLPMSGLACLVWVSCACLYVTNMGTGAGRQSFQFPYRLGNLHCMVTNIITLSFDHITWQDSEALGSSVQYTFADPWGTCWQGMPAPERPPEYPVVSHHVEYRLYYLQQTQGACN